MTQKFPRNSDYIAKHIASFIGRREYFLEGVAFKAARTRE